MLLHKTVKSLYGVLIHGLENERLFCRSLLNINLSLKKLVVKMFEIQEKFILKTYLK